MFKKIAVLVSLLFVATGAFAFEIKPYAALRAGVSDVHGSLDIGPMGLGAPADTALEKSNEYVFSGAVAVGAQWKFLRAELEYTYRDTANQDYTGSMLNVKLKEDMQSYMFNVYYDFKTTMPVSPYFMAGLGWSAMKAEVSGVPGAPNVSNDLFTYALGAGLTYALSEKINLDMGYRYTDVDTMDLEGIDFQTFANEFNLGVRYTF